MAANADPSTSAERIFLFFFRIRIGVVVFQVRQTDGQTAGLNRWCDFRHTRSLRIRWRRRRVKKPPTECGMSSATDQLLLLFCCFLFLLLLLLLHHHHPFDNNNWIWSIRRFLLSEFILVFPPYIVVGWSDGNAIPTQTWRTTPSSLQSISAGLDFSLVFQSFLNGESTIRANGIVSVCFVGAPLIGVEHVPD